MVLKPPTELTRSSQEIPERCAISECNSHARHFEAGHWYCDDHFWALVEGWNKDEEEN